MKSILKLTGILSLLIIGVVACQKEETRGTGKMTVKMKDAPIDFDSVNVEVLRVEVKSEVDGWTTLETNAGVYNLLALQNDVTAILASDVELPVGKLSQMRLILGSANNVIIDNQSFPLELSSQANTGLKFNLNATINNGETVEVLIDFDAEKSIVVTGKETFKLKPVIDVESIIYY